MTDGQRDELVAAMTSGEWYQDGPELAAPRARCEAALESFNATPSRRDSLDALLGHIGEGVEVVPQFRCSYGFNVSLGTTSSSTRTRS